MHCLQPGWRLFALQVLAATLLMAAFLLWGSRHFDWITLRAAPLQRVALLAGLMAAAGGIYFGALAAGSVRLRQLARR